MEETFEHKTLSDICNMPHNYMYSLLYDYEKFVIKYGVIKLQDYIATWRCIPEQAFRNLYPGLIVYGCHGEQYTIEEEPYESDNEIDIYVEVSRQISDEKIETEILTCGDLYYSTWQNTKESFMKIKTRKEDEKLCPTLITKTNQLQN